jgi:O-6-methylguanine DNA methyltransferase
MFAVIGVWLEQAGPWWFAVATHEGRLVATAIGSDRQDATEAIRRCLPRGRAHSFLEEGPPCSRSVIAMLARLETGEEETARFELCPDCISESLARVLRAASAIPRGYVSSYGRIAAVADTEARVVGRAMATNPLYPIVPCHRVVGSDLSLVGYGGRQDPAALRAKLERLREEARGFWQEKVLEAAGGLQVWPVEWVIEKAARDGIDPGVQLPLL